MHQGMLWIKFEHETDSLIEINLISIGRDQIINSTQFILHLFGFASSSPTYYVSLPIFMTIYGLGLWVKMCLSLGSQKLINLFQFFIILNYLSLPSLHMGKIIENYSILEQLGQGVYGKVYKAVHMKTKQEVAIKVINAQKFKEIPKLEECTVNEINILSTIQNCPYIVRYIDMLKTVNNFYFVYEYCNGGTLDKLMQKEGPFPEKRALIYFSQMVEAFKVLSKNNIMHRDLKPDNILMHNGKIKLGDFGFCKPLESSNQMAATMLGSPIYMAPEVLKGETYNRKADIWSLGVVLFQMVYGKCPFESKSIAKLIKLLDEEDLIFPETPKISLTLRDLLKKMLVKDHNGRMDWPDIFQYLITETGEILPPKGRSVINEFQLRSSMKPMGNYGTSLMGSTSFTTSPVGSSNNLNQSQNISMNQNGTSPKINKGYETTFDERSMLKKSPSKIQTEAIINSELKSNMSFGRNELFVKNDRPGRLEMLLKNHGKLVSVNQIALDCLRLEREKNGSLPVSYLLFKNIEKELNIIGEGLRKEPFDSKVQQFKFSIEKQLQSIKQMLIFYRDCINEENSIALLGNFDEPNKMRIMKFYYENNKLDTIQQIILAAQIIDYLDEAMLIRRESYEKMGKEPLLKQVKNKFLKYI